MIHILPTKRGVGVELWGTHSDLLAIYELASSSCFDNYFSNDDSNENRNNVISMFSYEVRHAFQKNRQIKKGYLESDDEYYGSKFTWVQFIFVISVLKTNIFYSESNKINISLLLQLEHYLESAMHIYDEKGASKLSFLIKEKSGYLSSRYVYQCMRMIDVKFLELGGGKRAFRKLPNLFIVAYPYTEDNKSFVSSLEEVSFQNKINLNDLEIKDDHVDYDNLKW